MDEAKKLLVQNWLTRAQRDLATARKLAVGHDPFLDTAIYHCQQAAEKAIKGYLLYLDQVFERTHDVRALVALAETHEPSFCR